MDLSVKDLSVYHETGERRVDVFSGLSFDVSSGQSVAILGPSGVGKTSLLYNIAGIEAPNSGSINLAGIDVAEEARAGADLSDFRLDSVGMVFQFHYLLGEFSALENAAMPLLISGNSKKDALAKAEELLTEVGLGDRLEHRPGALSGGEQQRVAIARALIRSPGLVLADEPTGNLDADTANGVLDLLLDNTAKSGATLVMVTHSEAIAKRLGRKLYMSATGVSETK